MTHLTPKNNDLLFIFCGIPTVAFQSTYYMNRYNMSTSLKCAMSALNAACHSNRILLPTPDAFFSESVLSCYPAYSLAFYLAYFTVLPGTV